MANNASSADAAAITRLKDAGNPALRALGLPRLNRLKLPSRNWLIFIGIVGSWTSTLLYDRYYKNRSLRKWSQLVAHLSEEELPANSLQRKITIILAAPPGDGLRAAREHFHEYVKPILVAGALDWQVIEGRKEGDVRAGLAEQIRKLRIRNGEPAGSAHKEDSDENLVRAVREAMGVKDFEGTQGDLVIGRHTWKEYMLGLHEGWLGPLEPAKEPSQPQDEIAMINPPSSDSVKNDGVKEVSGSEDSTAGAHDVGSDPPVPSDSTKGSEKKDDEKKKATKIPPYIQPSDYPISSLSREAPSELPPSIALPLPHVLGFLNTPQRMYRFLNRRHLAEETGASVAALVLATTSRSFQHDTEFVSSIDPDASTPQIPAQQNSVNPVRETWEQEMILQDAERDWSKSVWQDDKGGAERTERIWRDAMVVDPRIGSRMRLFTLEDGAAERAEELELARAKNDKSLFEKAKSWAGYETKPKGGWEMGLVGGELD